MQIQLKHKRIPSKETHTSAAAHSNFTGPAAERDKLKQFPASNFNLHRAPEARAAASAELSFSLCICMAERENN
jgi:hypothetical protein